MDSEPEAEFLTVNQIAARFQINPQTVRNWIDRGELEALRLGSRRVRVRTTDLDQFIKRSTVVAVTGEIALFDALYDGWAEFEMASSPAEEAEALRKVAKAAASLARHLSR